ncbi:AbrB/MazE/SpoVT family DNA-binding domain-containing protein [Domibacillus indicus]|uniref:AbrB/MazE/SpoVT family DNA-binding domain-containing protein n=1 Tax=Domibacillus indicus TaxID=1437523 RepID=UPI000617F83A|nr:AbrB/MazE/SpoVT family DNA-binding domain-containing protein [Domibacillus indicus]
MIQVTAKRVVDGQGRVVLPKFARRKLGIQPEDHMLVTLGQEEIIIEKLAGPAGGKTVCCLSGIRSAECRSFSGGIHLSREAALLLLEEIKSKQ